MKRKFPKDTVTNPLAILRKSGYSHFVDPNTKEDSYILRLTADFYPRMHLYVEESGNNWSFNLHLDQKKASYSGTSKHAGEYEGSTVEREMERLTKWVAAETSYLHPELPGLPAPTEPIAIETEQEINPPPNDLFKGIF